MQNMTCFTVTTASALGLEGLGCFLPGGSRQSQSNGPGPWGFAEKSTKGLHLHHPDHCRQRQGAASGPAGRRADKKGQSGFLEDPRPGGSDLPEATWPHVAPAACGGAGSPFASHTHSANHRGVPEPRAGVATYFLSASVEGSSNLSPKANEERLPWTSPETAFLAEVGSSRPWTEAKTLQGRQGGEGALSGGTARGEGARASRPGSAPTRQGSGSEKNGRWSFSSRGGWREDPLGPETPWSSAALASLYSWTCP